MGEASAAVFQMTVLLIIALVGYGATKLGYLDDHVKTKMTAVLLNITLPCMILASTGNVSSSEVGAQVIGIFILAIVQFFVLLLSCFIFNTTFRIRKDQRSIYYFMSVFTNTGFIGIPICQAIYGDGSVLLCSVFIMAMGLFMYSIGIAILVMGHKYDYLATPSNLSGGPSKSRSDNETVRTAGITGKTVSPADLEVQLPSGKEMAIQVVRAVLSPLTISAAIALVIVFSGVHLPAIILQPCTLLGQVTGPVAMMLVGVIVAHMRIRDVVSEWRLYPYVVIRQLLFPMLMYVVLTYMNIDPLLVGIFVVMFAMPVGSMTPMFCITYKRDSLLCAKAVVVSTVLSFVIIPVLQVFMHMV